ncbi:hypothetical protein SAMN05444396_11162 [Flavobacterium segetis]|uniref:RiboL-PSP-HEPN domain-containing protein n=1 Tax=Flavobacterium segetis TaxID=271157 RepID=A0A1M5JKB4_9FLAO|nr:hypothetical protein [Flavobacterium segetis]SHG41002.1 hypothetical protein SAMN05444396_11162 [Flavobacterium segetis]
MINKLKYATISDIGISNLIFYNVEKEKELIQFCKDNLISCLPSSDRRSIYKLVKGNFENCRLERELCLNPFDRLFDAVTLKKFEKVDHNEIRFITEGEKIKGVVHIVDYNNEFLQVEFYRAFYKFENNIRTLLIKNKLTNEDFINWVRLKSENENNLKNQEHWKKRYNALMPFKIDDLERVKIQRLEVNPFQTFFLKELLEFCFDNDVIHREFINIDSICALRNSIAHNKDLTSIIENENGDLIYNFKNLQKFVLHAKAFFEAYEYLSEFKQKYK